MHQLPQEVAARGTRAGGARGTLVAAIALGAVLALAAPLRAEPPLPLRGGGGVTIDGAAIPAAEVWQEYAYTHALIAVIHPKAAGTVDEKAFEKAVAGVVDRNLLARAAAGRGLAISAAERAGLRAGQVASWRGEENFGAALKILGVTEDFLQRRMEMDLLARKLVEQEALGGDLLGEESQREFYRANAGRYLAPSSVVRYLLLPPRTEEGKLREIAQEALRLVGEGKDFSALVAGLSIHESAGRGGAVGGGGESASAWPYYRQLAGGLKPGRMSLQQRDAAGVHLYVRDCQLPHPFESVRDQVRADLTESLIGRSQRAWVERLRQGAAIEYLPGVPPATPPGGAPAHAPPTPL